MYELYEFFKERIVDMISAILSLEVQVNIKEKHYIKIKQDFLRKSGILLYTSIEGG